MLEKFTCKECEDEMWNESEGMSYQTPILRITSCFCEENSKIKKG